jgi:hypothetical protein
MADSRQITEGVQYQGKDESVQYKITVDPVPLVGSTPTVYVFDSTAPDTDIKATVMPAGSLSFSGAIVTLPNLTGLTIGHLYRVEVRYTDSINTLEPYFLVSCNR